MRRDPRHAQHRTRLFAALERHRPLRRRPDDIDGIVEHIDGFLDGHDGKLRISFDSVTELAYYAGDDQALEAVERILELLAEHDAVGLFHLSEDPHDEALVDQFRGLFDGVIDLDEDGSVDTEF